MERDERYLTTAEAANRLGVKPETVYAYVSRGLLKSVRARDRRGSLFAYQDVERLAERTHHSRSASGVVERIGTGISVVEDDRLHYRGHDATELATTSSPESVAHLLWTGALAEGVRCTAPAEIVDVARSAVASLPSTARLTDGLRVAIVVLGAADPLRFDLSPERILPGAGALVGALTDVLAVPATTGTGLAERLWPALTDRPMPPGLLNAALILLADHGLAASTVAARVAASARAHPYAVVSAGLGALDARYHGVSSTLSYRFLAEARADPIAALAEWLRGGEEIPGFGHRVYQDVDPRAQMIFSMLREQEGAHPVLRAVDTLTEEMARGERWPPNVDLALAAMMHIHDMRPDAGEAIFALARNIGWIAHALEEYEEPVLRFRPTGFYTARRRTDSSSAARSD
ncbi:citrate synthase [Phytoactinopolyspora halophila]|uniref:citrate synthase n=1 Tax=Phytoactinopolyspora halophila TaxID=1981511 RepID=UPI001B8A91EA|nr:citrate synthase [Phytoactinopolyspora halophila]